MKYIKIFLIYFLLTVSSGLVSQENNYADSLENLLNESANSADRNIKLLRALSTYYHKNENYEKGLRHKIHELQLLKEKGDDSLVAMAQERIGVMFYHTGSYDVAAEYFLESLQYFEDRNNDNFVAQIMGNLANVYTRIDNYEKAIEYLYRSKEIYEKKPEKYKTTLAGLYVNIGLAYTGNGDYDQAMHYYNRSLELIAETKNDLYIASIYNNMGEVYYKEKQYQQAYKYYSDALKTFKKLDHKNGIGTALSNLAKVEIQNKNYDSAIKLGKSALEYFESIGSKFFISDVHTQLMNAYKKKGDFQKALEHMELYLKVHEEIKGNEITARIASIELKNKIRKEEQKLQLIQQQAKIKEKEAKLDQLNLYIVLGGILVALIVTVLITINQRGRLQRNTLKQEILQRDQEQLQNKLQFKKREIENFAIHIQEKNELLQSLNTEIKNVAKNNDIDYKDLNEITNLVNHSLYIDSNRKELELKINQAQQDFLHRLKSKFDWLTKTDLRLCSFLILEFSTKEIAAFMNIEPSSVKTSRNRLRKKLNLPPNTDLKAFLDKI